MIIKIQVAENHWRSIHAVKAERAAEEREKKKRELKERIRSTNLEKYILMPQTNTYIDILGGMH